jgi:hypothetical protein
MVSEETMGPIGRFVFFIIATAIFSSAHLEAKFGTPPDSPQVAPNFFASFIGEYKVVSARKSIRNGEAHDYQIFKVQVEYEDSKEGTKGKVLTLKHVSNPDGGILSQPLVNSESKTGGGEQSTEVVGLDDGARVTTKTKYDGDSSTSQNELHRDGSGQITYRYVFDNQSRDGDDTGEVVLVLEKVTK